MGVLIPPFNPSLYGLSSLYTGQVATRAGWFPNFPFSTTNVQIQARTMHYMRDTTPWLKVVLPAFTVPFSSNTSELETGVGTGTIAASLEYPLGVFTQLTFGGASAGAFTNNSVVTSDAVANPVPNGAKFWIRAFYINASGQGLYASQAPAVADDGCEYGVTLTNKLAGGTIAQQTAGINIYPCAIVGPTRRPSVYLGGDSQQFGFQDTAETNCGDGGIMARAIGPTLAYINGGCVSDGPDLFIVGGNSTIRQALAQYCSHHAWSFGSNSMYLRSLTAAQTITAYNTLIGLFPNQPFYASTVQAITTSTDSWATPVAPFTTGTNNQTFAASSAALNTFNQSIRTGALTGAAGYFELADIGMTYRDSGFWKGPGYVYTDGLHSLRKLNMAIAAAGVINPARFTR